MMREGLASIILETLRLAAVVMATTAAAQTGPDRCAKVTGTITTVATTEACASAVGLCFSGAINTKVISGTTFFVADVFHPATGTSEVIQYAGTLAITLLDGTVVRFRSHGTVNLRKNSVSETDIPIQGSEFKGALHIRGTALPLLAGFTGEVTGVLCEGPQATSE
jgi:hypothetical protein